MPAREIVRRVAVWAVVALYLVVMIIDASAFGDATGLIAFTGFPVVGAIVLTSRPRNGVGWFLLAYGVGWIIGSYTLTRLWGDEPTLSGAIIGTAFGYLLWPITPLIGALFPSGRFETRLGAASGWTLIAVNVLGAAGQAFAPTVWWTNVEMENPLADLLPPGAQQIGTIVYAVIVLSAIAGIAVDVILRWRRSNGATRQQFKWFGFGLLSTLTIYVGIGLGVLLPIQPYVDEATYGAVSMVFLFTIEFIPISIGIAVTRHGLYDIGRVVSRTVTYAIVAIAAIGVYAAVVLAASFFVPGDNPVLVAIATLIAAALFLPLLRWVQRGLDRAFDRERYDAERVVESFGTRLRAEVDPETTVPDLVDAVGRTLRPSAIGVWTR